MPLVFGDGGAEIQISSKEVRISFRFTTASYSEECSDWFKSAA